MAKSFLAVILLSLILKANARSCVPRDYGNAAVCVCNMTYCDELPTIDRQYTAVVLMHETNKNGLRFKESKLKFGAKNISLEGNESSATLTQTISINRDKKYQRIIGFGGAFTDAAGINIASLPLKMQHNVMKDYFAPTGLEYSMGRIPIGGCDFSTYAYSYDDHPGDINLTQFKLTKEDHLYKIPMLHLAKNLSHQNVRLFASPWSPPAWMKTNNKFQGGGFLIGKPGGEYYQTWANYFVKFLDAYKHNGIEMWGLTVENEPIAGFDPDYKFNCLGLSPEMERDFVKMNLGPTLAKAGYGADRLKLMVMDDERDYMIKWADTMFADKDAAKYVSGIAFHWYHNDQAPVSILDKTHDAYPEYFLLSTEACTSKGGDKLGGWEKGELYAYDIITDLQHWTTGWVDWNLALDMQGGPNWVSNFVDAPILVNASSKEYYKQPMFYVLAHFAKLLPPDSVKIESVLQQQKIPKFENVAFQRPDGAVVLLALNMNDEPVSLTIDDPKYGKLSTQISARAIKSYVWWDNH